MKWHEKLKVARNSKGLTCREVEKLTGISNAYINQIENGLIKDPSFFKIHHLLSLYGLSPDDILKETPIGNILKWILTEDGMLKFEDAQKKAERAIFELKQAMKIDPDILHKPMDI